MRGKIAYAACVFLRCEENSTTCQLIRARCGIAPMKSLSFPETGTPCMQYGTRLSQSVSSDINGKKFAKIFGQDSADAFILDKRRKPGPLCL
ncbi:hypothetical protein TNIN_235431 [Trichonephila inaurata madagascariensis]|uniref:Uncharacterized protein n=1 Tax=Trichonephila inaurata madagascariensis TaxID=2747483 RepID=A0A8X7C0M0_9ARAC|nr:hypothetical protein TNIN_235431 [Trichonephila inaurata madagascariensis]